MLSILKSTLRSTLIYSFGNLSSKLLGILLIPLYASKLSITEYGMLGMLEITTQILSTLFGVSLYHAFFRWYWDKQFVDKQKSIFFTILIFILITGVAFNLILIPFHKEISFLLLDSNQYTYLITLVILISGLEALALIISTLIRLQDKPGKYTFLLISKFTISLLFTIYFIAYKGKKIDGIYEAQLIGNAVFFLLVAGFVKKNISIKFELNILRKMLQFCYPLLFTAIAGIIFTITDRYVLRFITDLSYVGIYSLGYKIANTLKVFIIASVHLALQPIIYKMMDDPEHKRFYSKVMTYFTFGVMIFALGLSLFGKEMIKFLAQKNPDYWEAFNIVPLIILGLIFGMLKDVSTIGINITKRTKVYAWTIIIVSLINLGLNLIFIPLYGYMGAAAATVFSQLLYFIILYSIAQKFYHIPYEIFKIIKILVLGSSLYLLSTLSNEMSLVARLLIKSGIILVFPFLLYLVGFYEKIEIVRLRGFWVKWKNPSAISGNIRELLLKDKTED